MIVIALHNTVGSNSLVLIFLIFEAYPCIHSIDLLASTIIWKTADIEKVIDEIEKIWAKSQVTDVFNIKNGPFVNFIDDLFLNSDILVWEKSNVRQSGK